MGMISYIKEEINVVKDRDPAIKSNLEVLLYPSFKVMLSYRVAHKLYMKNIILMAKMGFAESCSQNRYRDTPRSNNRKRIVY